ncbi:class V chitinase-like [Cornus florida]|uniref:class V chitinase-like n=1 Tax=Cornus florida TaxID=4283 RepID=UPI0028996A36|nr:class V chitinase-like [Cornus florida]
MASKTSLFLLVCLLFLHNLPFSAAQTVVKAAYWFPESGFAASDINSTLFTHLFCAFATLSNTNRTTIPASNNASFAQFTRTVQLKNPSVKTLLSIGGGSANKTIFASMASQPSSRKTFIDSSIKLARDYGFYGLDLDWEYPEVASQMTNFGSLLDEWRSAVSTEANTTGKTPLILTAAVFYRPNYYGPNYPVQSIARSLDWINLMAYDFYGPGWSPSMTNAPAALYDPTGQLSGSYGIGAWIQGGVPAKKLVLGLPFYGYAWRLVNANNHGLLAPANGSTSGDGSMGYNQIKVFISQNNAATVYNATVVTDYCYAGTTWIGYDDIQSITAKVSYAKQQAILGYFAWHVGVDNNWVLSQKAYNTWGA